MIASAVPHSPARQTPAAPARAAARRGRRRKRTPPAEPLHVRVARDLSRPVDAAPVGGVISTLLLAVPTFGLLPALAWPLRWAAFAAEERRQYRRLADWVRLNTRHHRAEALRDRAAALRARPLLTVVPVACCFVLAALVVSLLAPLGADALVESTYGFAGSAARVTAALFGADPLTERQGFFAAWVGLLSLAYGAHWLQVHLHARGVRRMLDEFNVIAVDEGLAPVLLAPVGTGVRPLWTLGAVGLILLNAPWGVALALAGAVRRGYARRASPTMRAALADRVRMLLATRRPPALAAAPARTRCATSGCRLPLPAGARFCPRCGRQAILPLDRLA